MSQCFGCCCPQAHWLLLAFGITTDKICQGSGLGGIWTSPRGGWGWQESVPGVSSSVGCPCWRYPPLWKEFPVWIYDCHTFSLFLASPKREAGSCPAWWWGRVKPCQPLLCLLKCLVCKGLIEHPWEKDSHFHCSVSGNEVVWFLCHFALPYFFH